MALTVSINQPAYLPWLPYFDRIRLSDIHVVLDHVQYEKGSFTNRTRIRQRDGRVCWLTVPVEKGKPINETSIRDGRWRKKHPDAIDQAYGAGFPELYELAWGSLSDLARSSALTLAAALGLANTQVPSSVLGGDKLGHKSDLVLNICKQLGATRYISGPQGANYLDIPAFEKAGIQVTYYIWQPPTLPLSAVHNVFSGEPFAWPDAQLVSAHD